MGVGSIIRLRRAKNRNALFSVSHSRPGETGSLEVPLWGLRKGRDGGSPLGPRWRSWQVL